MYFKIYLTEIRSDLSGDVEDSSFVLLIPYCKSFFSPIMLFLMLKIANFSPLNYVTQCNVVKILLAFCDFTVVSKCNFLIKKITFWLCRSYLLVLFLSIIVLLKDHIPKIVSQPLLLIMSTTKKSWTKA